LEVTLKPGVSTPSLDASFTSATYRLDKVPEGCLRDGVPPICRTWTSLARVAGGAWFDPRSSQRCLIGLNRASTLPKTFHLLTLEVGDELGPMRMRIVVFEDGALLKGNERQQSNRP